MKRGPGNFGSWTMHFGLFHCWSWVQFYPFGNNGAGENNAGEWMILRQAHGRQACLP
jgi:hypothetical protein